VITVHPREMLACGNLLWQRPCLDEKGKVVVLLLLPNSLVLSAPHPNGPQMPYMWVYISV